MKGFLAVSLLCTSLACGADPVRFTSGEARVSLIELYTSEGCSSCPPADQWLGGLKDDKGLWKSFVPVEFHVNYWDNLGWKDRLSSREYTAREYSYASAWGSPNVYTPCFVRDGAEWRRTSGSPDMSGGLRAPVGRLSVTVASDGSCTAHFQPASPNPLEHFHLHAAFLGGGLYSKPTAGENEGATLSHEFVVLGLSEVPMNPTNAGLEGHLTLPAPSVTDAKRHALAAWVSLDGNLEPIQATGGWLP